MVDGAPGLIAVVDDEPSVRSSLARLLRSADYASVDYESGEAFLDSLETAPPDCVILDLRMPGLSGFEVLARLAAHKPRVPVVILTSYPSGEARNRALAQGADFFLTKPVDRIVLLEAVEGAIGTRNRDEAAQDSCSREPNS